MLSRIHEPVESRGRNGFQGLHDCGTPIEFPSCDGYSGVTDQDKFKRSARKGLATHEHGVRAKLPILAKETDKYPEGVFEMAEASLDLAWYLLYTRSRREKELMRRLAAGKIPFYGPCAKKKTRSPAGRVRTSWVPLFTNYVFLLGDADAIAQAHRTNCLSNVTAVSDKEALTASLRRLDQLISSEAPVHVEQRLAPGELVRVKAGPFKGCEGVVEKRRGGSHLVVNVDFVQQSVSVELDDFMVEKL